MNSIIYDNVIYLNLFYNKIERIFTSYGYFFYNIMLYLGQMEITQSPDQVSYLRTIQEY